MKSSRIVWEEVHRRVQANELSLRETFSETPEHIKKVFRRRAIQLAKAHSVDKPASKGISALIFRVAQERYAVPLHELAEVLPFRGCTAIPGSPPQLLGVINLRGELRAVIALSQILSGTPPEDSGAILVLRREAALKVDALENLHEIASEELTRPRQGHYIHSIASGTLALLDVESMLSAVFTRKESRSL